jgi:asparagine synthase (glutamine-hydrolysing)
MCGIAGIVGRPATDRADPLAAALRALAPRGPDGLGREGGRLGRRGVELGVRVLDLVDPGGHPQPARRPSGARLVLNGEVYNHAELRRRLHAEGETFGTAGDSEVLAAVLERWGPGGLEKVEGGYAFAYLDAQGRSLLLGRDPLGVRPLAYANLDDGLVFASTLDGILATGCVAREPDVDSLADVLRDGVVRNARTALRGVRRVQPGQVLEVTADLRIAECRRVPASPLDAEAEEPPLDVLEALRLAVRDRVCPVRPTAVFLSGGVDSALVAALAREVGDLPALTLTYPGLGRVDEARRAQRTARRLGILHVVVPCPRDPTPWVLGAAEAFDEPFADASAVPTWGLGLAAARRARVALTGTGGDEVFGGYRRYWMMGAGPWLRHVPGFVRRPVSAVLERSLPDGARVIRASEDPEGFYRGLLRLQTPAEVRALLGPRLRLAGDPSPSPGARSAEEAMADDFVRYLPDDLLVKEDRALGAHGMEGRHPFLDHRVRRAARSLELRGNVARGRQKQVLRAYVRQVLDPDLARTPKHGFAFPVDDLYRGPLRRLAEQLILGRALRERGLIDPRPAARLLREHTSSTRNAGAILHAIVMLELWARRVLDGAPIRR